MRRSLSILFCGACLLVALASVALPQDVVTPQVAKDPRVIDAAEAW